MKCKIKAFGISKDIVGGKLVELEVPEGKSVADLKKELFEKYPDFNALKSLYIALNNEYADDHALLKEGDEIALIPPVSGG
ncbi:MAG TPA: MoaD/ThiS family protein [Cyclobacteriaceae bacterium]